MQIPKFSILKKNHDIYPDIYPHNFIAVCSVTEDVHFFTVTTFGVF